MTYAIIKVAGKQYRVREGERLLVDRLAHDDGATFTPTVLLVGGDGEAVLGSGRRQGHRDGARAEKGPKIRIGKYKKRTGYRRHTGFRASLTQIQIESIGGKRAAAAAKPKTEKADKTEKAEPASSRTSGVEGHAVGLRGHDRRSDQGGLVGAGTRPMLEAALEYEQAHAQAQGRDRRYRVGARREGGDS